MTVFTVPRVARPISEDMFTDLGVPHVTFQAVDGGIQVTVPADLTAAQILRGKIRLLTSNAADEATLVAAVGALAGLDSLRADLVPIHAAAATYAANPAPKAEDAIAATVQLAAGIARLCDGVTQVAADVHGLIEWVGKDALGGSL